MKQYLYGATLVAFFIVAIGIQTAAQQVRLISSNGQVLTSKNLINNTAIFENLPPNGEYKLTLWINDTQKCMITNKDCLCYPNKNSYCKFSGHIIWNNTSGEFLEHKGKGIATGNFVCYIERKNSTLLVQYYP